MPPLTPPPSLLFADGYLSSVHSDLLTANLQNCALALLFIGECAVHAFQQVLSPVPGMPLL